MYRSNLRLVFGVVIAFIITVFVVSVAQAAKPDCAKDPSHPSCKDDGGSGGGEPSNPDPAFVMVAVHSKAVLNELLVANADGSNQSALLSSETEWYFWPAWSPDLNLNIEGFQGSIVFETRIRTPEAQFVDLHIIDVDVAVSGVSGSDLRMFTNDAFHAAWSSQDMIAYVGNHDTPDGIFIGTAKVRVIPNPSGSFAHVDWPAWNPEGTHLAYASYYQDDEEKWNWSIRIQEVVNLEGEILNKPSDVVLQGLDETDGRLSGGIQWSPDGNFLAYRLNSAIEVLDLATNMRRPFADTTWALSPTWSPSGNKLAYMSRNGSAGAGKRKIVLYDLDTDAESVIIERKGFHLFEPDWRRF